jgi:hypothetical protein
MRLSFPAATVSGARDSAVPGIHSDHGSGTAVVRNRSCPDLLFGSVPFTLGTGPAFYLFEEANYWKILLFAGCIILALYFQDLCTDLRISSRILLTQ